MGDVTSEAATVIADITSAAGTGFADATSLAESIITDATSVLGSAPTTTKHSPAGSVVHGEPFGRIVSVIGGAALGVWVMG